MRSLAPAVVPAFPDIPEVLKDIDYDWLSFLNAETNSKEELGYLDSGPISTLQTGSGGTLSPNSCQSSHSIEPLNIHTPDHDDSEAFDIATVYQDTAGAVGSIYSFDSHSPYALHGYHSKPSRGWGRPLTSIVGRLTNLSMALYECAGKLPSIKISRTESAGPVNVPCAMNSTRREGALLALDEVFRVTNEFINIMKNPYSIPDCPETPTLTITSTIPSTHSTQTEPTINPLYVVPQVNSDQQRSVTEPMFQSPNVEAPNEPEISSSMQPFSHLDEATMLLFLSCHCRLVEIYSSVFQAMRQCLEGSNATPRSRAGVILPQLQVGGSGGISSPALRVDFNGPLLPPATVSMYMTLITTLSSQLWAQVAEGLRKGKGYDNLGNQAHIPHLRMVGPTWGLAMERTDDVKQTIELVKRLL
ncbi:hypothetical protein FHL15_000209 [Xylaria flabelliformis]|uniref:Aflatoxin regulatory protein domain-containing protein n=1 Tax=Xylaria flabelliformis TaxID=2512241 RepID=A0A553IF98_9PEZI|nr:hypothetical protein FHL15_000209 [Xylaria flabelliformis]